MVPAVRDVDTACRTFADAAGVSESVGVAAAGDAVLVALAVGDDRLPVHVEGTDLNPGGGGQVVGCVCGGGTEERVATPGDLDEAVVLIGSRRAILTGGLAEQAWRKRDAAGSVEAGKSTVVCDRAGAARGGMGDVFQVAV